MMHPPIDPACVTIRLVNLPVGKSPLPVAGFNLPDGKCLLAVARWLKIISHLNPLTCVVDALRTLMLAGSTNTFGLSFDYAVILFATTILVFLGARLYPRLAT
jgi:ABC-type multidrug transport system permease subunit